MSTAKFDTLSNLAGTQTVPVATVAQGSAKAWVNFNGTGTVAIRASFNVSSITDNGTGDYTVNFTTAMPDTNYSLGGSARGTSGNLNGGGMALKNGHTKTTSAVKVASIGFGSTSVATSDLDEVNVQIFR